MKPGIGVMILLIMITGFLPAKAGKNKMQDHSQKVDYRIQSENTTVVLYYNDRKLLLYTWIDTLFKPYVKELFTPAGLNVLLDSPNDHKHHHGLMLAYKVDGINYWEETENSGRQKSLEISEIYSSSERSSGEAGFSTTIHWIGPEGGTVALKENRTIRGEFSPRLEANLFDWQSRILISDSKSPVQLAGAHYNGLGLRFVRSMDNAGQFVTAENKKGEIFRGQERLIPDRWCAYLSQVGNKKVTLAMFAAPGNPRGLTTWFTMKVPFAYMSATMKLHENPMTLHASDLLSLHYGVALWDGHVDIQRIEEAYQYWINHGITRKNTE
jgi:hypothetical protein